MSTRDPELASIMAAAQAGDAKAYRRLLDGLSVHLKPHIRRLLAGMGSNGAAELDDILQETLIAVHGRLHTYDPTYPVTAWVNAIARYKVVDHFRAVGDNRRKIPIETVESLMSEPEAEQADAARDVQRLLATLPANLRRPIEEVKLRGLSIAEAAHAVGMSQAAVKVGIHRGMKRLIARFGIGAASMAGNNG
ncbi:MAG: sigma-70 family RNA polymerase sigma factor [Ancalomicrobiaceae bacterium]|nr:sigma-70 family RNA polymerase sigma factor [Ancalomicrobiaceae bacterium]